jgi:subtilisin family serine protease
LGQQEFLSREEHRILVTFRDGSIERIPIGDATSAYRRRGPYRGSTWSARTVVALAESYGLLTVGEWPITTLGVHCVVYRVPDDQSVDKVLDALSRDERVESAQRMRTFRVLSGTHQDPYARLQPALQAMNVDLVHRYAQGRDVQVALIDTGVDTNHPDLRGQVIETKNFTASPDEPADDVHGTAVAGIIAALKDNDIGITGIAPASKIVALKACWPEQFAKPDAVCDTFTLAQALNTAVRLKTRIVNLSLAGPRDPLLERLIAAGIEEGLIFVASAPPLGSREDFPAFMEGVIAVQTIGPRDAPGDIATHTVSAPGTEVLTTLPHGIYNFVSGSSYATAHVTGVIALLLQLRQDLSAASVMEILRNSERGHSPADPNGLVGLDACRAVAQIERALTCQDTAQTPGRLLAEHR